MPVSIRSQSKSRSSAAAPPCIVVLPLSVVSYNGNVADDDPYSIRNVIAPHPPESFDQSLPHCSKDGCNFDLLLRFDEPEPCTMTHFIIRQPLYNCTSPLKTGVLFVSSGPEAPDIDSYSDQYRDCDTLKFSSISSETRAKHGAVTFFTMLDTQPLTVIPIPPAQASEVRFVHLKLVRGLETNVDVGRIVAVGYKKPHIPIPLSPAPLGFLLHVLQELKPAWLPGQVQPFQGDNLSDVLTSHPFMLLYCGQSVEPEMLENVADLTSIVTDLAAKFPAIACFVVSKAAELDDPALRSYLTDHCEENGLADWSQPRLVMVHIESGIKSMADRESLARLPAEDQRVPRALMCLATATTFCAAVYTATGGQVKLSSEVGDAEKTTEDVFMDALTSYSGGVAQIMITCVIRRHRCISVDDFKARLADNDCIPFLENLMASYWNKTWLGLCDRNSDEDEYLHSIISKMMSTGPFRHRPCLFVFVFDYNMQLLQRVAQALQRSSLTLPKAVEDTEAFRSSMQPHILDVVSSMQGQEEALRTCRTRDGARHWICAESATERQDHCRGIRFHADRPFSEFLASHGSIKSKNPNNTSRRNHQSPQPHVKRSGRTRSPEHRQQHQSSGRPRGAAKGKR